MAELTHGGIPGETSADNLKGIAKQFFVGISADSTNFKQTSESKKGLAAAVWFWQNIDIRKEKGELRPLYQLSNKITIISRVNGLRVTVILRCLYHDATS